VELTSFSDDGMPLMRPERAIREITVGDAWPSLQCQQYASSCDGDRMEHPAYYALLRMRRLSISCAEGFVVISCGKVDYDKSGWRDD
jgi:hypothetical protein